MPPDDPNKNISSIPTTVSNSPLPADQPVSPTPHSQNVWGQPPAQNLPTSVLPTDPGVINELPALPTDPNKNIWGQPIEPILQTTQVQTESLASPPTPFVAPAAEEPTPMTTAAPVIQEPAVPEKISPTDNVPQPLPGRKGYSTNNGCLSGSTSAGSFRSYPHI
jgi:hypothetical protein